VAADSLDHLIDESPGINLTVTFSVAVLIGAEAFAAEEPLKFIATRNKTGTARFPSVIIRPGNEENQFVENLRADKIVTSEIHHRAMSRSRRLGFAHGAAAIRLLHGEHPLWTGTRKMLARWSTSWL